MIEIQSVIIVSFAGVDLTVSAPFFYIGQERVELSKKRTGVEEKFYNICQEVVKENSLELYDMDYITGSSTLRVFIMNPKTKSAVIEDCVKIDRAMTPYFEEDWIPDDIVLEVSSPGVYRAIKTLEHFKMSKDEMVLFNLEKSLDEYGAQDLPKALKKAKKVRGKLIEVNDNNIKVKIEDFEFAFDYENIRKATLDPDL